MPMILALSGAPGSGKDLTAQFLVEKGNWVRVAFADKVREMALAIDPCIHNGYNRDYLADIVEDHGWAYTKTIPEVRRFLQQLGTQAREFMGKSVWVDMVRATVSEAVWALKPKNVVVTDVRFPNELEFLKCYAHPQIGPTYVHHVRLWRPDQSVMPGSDHEVEHALDHVKEDYRLLNTGSPDDLRKAVEDMLEDLRAWEESRTGH